MELTFLLHFQNVYNISNNNFVKVIASNASMVAMYDTKKVKEVLDSQILKIPVRSSLEFKIPMNVTFGDEEGYLV